MSETDTRRWWVTQQMETTHLNDSGVFVPGVQVTFRTAEGATGSVFVPKVDYTVAKVRDMIEAAAAEVSAVAKLEG